jgi:hypothetical protein
VARGPASITRMNPAANGLPSIITTRDGTGLGPLFPQPALSTRPPSGADINSFFHHVASLLSSTSGSVAVHQRSGTGSEPCRSHSASTGR